MSKFKIGPESVYGLQFRNLEKLQKFNDCFIKEDNSRHVFMLEVGQQTDAYRF